MKTSPRIPVLLFTEKGKKEIKTLSEVLASAQELKDNLENLRYNPHRHPPKRAGNSFLNSLETETILEELNMPELTESLVAIWETVHNNKRGTDFESSYIAEQLKTAAEGTDDDGFQWEHFITSEEIQDLIEREWIEIQEDILEEFREMSNDYGIEQAIYDHSRWITQAMRYDDRKDVPEPFLSKLADAIENNPAFFGQPVHETLRENLEAFKLAQDRLHQTLNAIDNQLHKLKQ